ncbi:MAG: RNA methyltransferase [Chitinophagaceae bacterium]|nr:MAG: RNA methyltransferase [Chitinophagaceae bacterium]
MDIITSAQNPKIKDLARLKTKAPYRKKTGFIWVEGNREMNLAIQNGYELQQFYFNAELENQSNIQNFEKNAQKTYAVKKEVFSKVTYRGDTEGVLGLFKIKELGLENLKNKKNPFYIILESVEKPGNLGAVLRTADASGCDAVIVCDPHTDIFHPNVVRASIGCCFSIDVIQADSETIIDFLKKENINIFSAALQNAITYFDSDFTKGSAIVLGKESTGLTEKWRSASDQIISIPMMGKIDSLNVSNAAAVLAYEVLRQRMKKTNAKEKP